LPLERPRILLADDHVEFLAMVTRLVDGEFEVVHTFQDGLTLVRSAETLDADLLVMDISMPGLNGIDAARQLRAAGCQTKVVFLTVHEDQDYLRSAMATGAFGYVIKSRLATDLVPALREALADHRFVSGSLMQDAPP
jgi:DNA-binding NarL/FixJ family response regulator